ncbi:hypothetical protein CFC21_047777 [Triticum aestivum]|uniref:Methyltransferase domain-containing protein n=2 Tax=Triticum aestivum TaxID=4565 RepID=A0A9R1K1F9_WHEAT|nr:hypothetical protein CFC21_047777 [Triticum aestivum]
MAGIRLTPEEPELPQGTPPRPQLPLPVAGSGVTAGGGGSGGLEMASDDERSVAADSWSVRSEYGSTLDDDQRYADAADVLAAAAAAGNFPSAASDYCSDKDDQDSNEESSMLGLQSYWDASYSEDLANFQEHGHAGEIWFSDLTGTDYSEGAIELARNLAARDGFTTISFLVDDVLETKLDRKFKVITDKGTLDAIGLHPDGRAKRVMYWESISNLVEPGGLVVITSCNHTKDELLQEVEEFGMRKFGKEDADRGAGDSHQIFRYLDHVQTYPTIMFGGVEGSQVCTVAFQRV